MAPLSILVLVTAAALIVPDSPAVAQQRKKKEKKEKKKNLVVSPVVFKKLEAIHKLLEEEQIDAAISLLDKLADRSRLTDHEKAIIWQTYGFAYSTKTNYEKAAESFAKCLEIGALHKNSLITIRFNLGQLYMALEEYDLAVEELLTWEKEVETPGASAYYLIGQAYTQLGQLDKALPYIQKAVDESKEFKESWWQLLLALNVQEKNYKESVEILAVLLKHAPKKTYFQQLQGVYSELGEEKKMLAVMELSYRQGYLDTDQELRNLSHLYLYHEIPEFAAHVIEKGLQDGTVEGDREAWELLADSWIHAREYDRAIEPLSKAAEKAENGEVYIKLAQVYMENEDWSGANASIDAAIKKGDLKDAADAHLMMGISSMNGEQYKSARSAFNEAAKSPSTRDSARNWLKHLDNVEREIAAEAAAEAEFRRSQER